MLVLISGVVLLTYKKPEPKGAVPPSSVPLSGRGHRSTTKASFAASALDEEEALHEGGDAEREDAAMWQLGDASDDDDDGSGGARSPRAPRSPRLQSGSPRVQRRASGLSLKLTANVSQLSLSRGRSRSYGEGEEASMLAEHDSGDEQVEARRRTSSSSDSDATLARPDAVAYVDDDAFGAWEAAPAGKAQD